MESKKTFVQNLQGIRGYAIILIFLSHCNFGTNEAGINRTTWLGALGVTLFIMLSGYLLIENHGKESIRIFPYIKKKVSKFYPLHIITMLATLPFVIKNLIHFDCKYIIGMLANVSITQAWIPNADIYFSYNAVSWYLSVTLFCVVMSPMILRFWKNVDNNAHYIKIFVTFGVCLFIDCILYLVFGKSSFAHWIIYIFPVIRLLEYVFGGGYIHIAKNL